MKTPLTWKPIKDLVRAMLLVALATTFASAQATKQSPRLKLNETLERELVGSGRHEYLVTLKVNDFVQVRVEQKGIDVEVSLYGNLMVAEMDSPNGAEGFETLSWVAKSAGVYRFQVSRLAEESNAAAGRYSITLTAQRPATEADHKRIRAEQMFIQVVKSPLASRHDISVRIRQYEPILADWRDLKDERMVSLIENAVAQLKTLLAESEAEADTAGRAKLVVQTNHAILIQSVAFSLDGKILATGDGGGAIKLWDIESGRQLRTIEGHPRVKMGVSEEPSPAKSRDWLVNIFEMFNSGGSTVHSLAFSPDGKTLASGSSDKTIRIWDVATGKQEKFFTQPIKVWLIAFNQDGSQLLSIAEDGSYKYWDVAGEKEIKVNPPPLSSFRLPWQSPGGRLTASYSEKEKTIRLIDTANGKQKVLEGHEAGVRRAVFSPDGGTLASCGWDRKVRLWDTAGRKPPKVLSGHTAFISSVAFSSDGKLVASVGADLTVKLWEVESGKELKTLRGYGDFVEPFAFGKDDKILLTAIDNIMHAWDMEEGRKLGGAPIHGGNVNIVLFSPDKRIFATSDQSGIDIMEMPRLGPILMMAKDDIGPANKGLNSDNVIRLWDVESGQRLHTLKGHTEEIAALAFSGDGKILASASHDSTVKLWSVDNGKEIATLKGHTSWVTAVAISHDGARLASHSHGVIKLWDVAHGRELRTLERPSDDSSYLKWLGFSSNGETVVAVGEDGVVRLWGFESGRLEDAFSVGDREKMKTVLRLVPDYHQKLRPYFTTDLRLAVTGESGGKMALRDAASGRLLAWLIALDEIDWAVITPDGLFDASLKARKQMHYVIGLEPITLEQMKDLYYVPGLLAKIFKGAPLPPVELFSAADLFPLAEYQPPQPGQQSFTVKLINRGGGIGHVQVIVNDKECGGDARPANFDPTQPSVTLQIDLTKCGLLVPGQPNRVEVVARNAAGSLNSRGSSRGAEIIGMFGGEGKAEPPHVYAIVGGVSDYTGNNLDLSYAAKDAEDFAKAFEAGASKLFGADKVHIRLLTSNADKSGVKFSTGDAKSSTATKANFKRAFDDFKDATPSDIFVVYLAGHGVSLNTAHTPSKPGGGVYLYLTQEATTTDTEVLAVEQTRRAMSLSSDELAEMIKQNRALKQVLILDTCAAGAAMRDLTGRRELPTDQIKAIDRLQGRTGFFVLMGSAADRVSYETTQYRQGLLTYSLLQAMKGFKLRDGKFADVNELFIYAQDTVPRLAKNIGGIQRPIVISPERERSLVFGERGSFDIGMFTAEEQRGIRLASPKPYVLRPTLINRDLGYDNLDLTPLLREALREESDTPGSGETESALSFVDADEMVDAVKLSGLYAEKGDVVHVTLRLIRNKVPIETTLTVEGKVGEKAQLIKQLVAAIVRIEFPIVSEPALAAP